MRSLARTAPDTVTIIANYVPLQAPDGGPNFFEFGAKTVVGSAAPVGDDVLYQIHIDNTGTGIPSITYQFQFTTTILDPNTFLYATGPITYSPRAGYSSTWNRRQTYTVTRIDTDPGHGGQHVDADQPALGQRRCLRLPTVQCRHPHHAELRLAFGSGGVSDVGRPQSSSPASGPTASSWTSGPSSTSATCGRSRATS